MPGLECITPHLRVPAASSLALLLPSDTPTAHHTAARVALLLVYKGAHSPGLIVAPALCHASCSLLWPETFTSPIFVLELAESFSTIFLLPLDLGIFSTFSQSVLASASLERALPDCPAASWPPEMTTPFFLVLCRVQYFLSLPLVTVCLHL